MIRACPVKEGEDMERIKELDRYQKGILLLLSAMIVLFGVIYAIVSSRVGFLYNDGILIPSQENGSTVYSGTIRGQECRFTVTADKTVTFQCGEKIYGPYTAKEDPTARPEDQAYLTGVEILEGEKVFFRGGVWRSGDGLMLFEEDGGIIIHITATMSNGTVVDSNGNIVDQMAPSPTTVLELMDGPELTNKGQWGAWFGAVVISIFTAVSILFADELFRLNLMFRVRDVDMVDPSDWEVASRYIAWTIMAITAFAVYIIGLQ